jgi:hypothetical protein
VLSVNRIDEQDAQSDECCKDAKHEEQKVRKNFPTLLRLQVFVLEFSRLIFLMMMMVMVVTMMIFIAFVCHFSKS